MDCGENTDEEIIKRIYQDLDILFCEAITDAGLSEDPAKVLAPLKHDFAEMQNKNHAVASKEAVNECFSKSQEIVTAPEISTQFMDIVSAPN